MRKKYNKSFRTSLFYLVLIPLILLVNSAVIVFGLSPWINLAVSAVSSVVCAFREIWILGKSDDRESSLCFLQVAYSMIKSFRAYQAESQKITFSNTRAGFPNKVEAKFTTIFSMYRTAITEKTKNLFSEKEANKKLLSWERDFSLFHSAVKEMRRRINPTQAECKLYEIPYPEPK